MNNNIEKVERRDWSGWFNGVVNRLKESEKIKKLFTDANMYIQKGITYLFTKFPGLKDWLDRQKERPFVKKTIQFYHNHRSWFTWRKIRIVLGIIILAAIIHYLPSCWAGTAPQNVTVARAVAKTVPFSLNYVGTTASVRSVDIRARVEGFLVEQAFTEGDNVKEGDLMYVIDPREYEAELEKSIAKLAEDEANLAYAQNEVDRYRILVEKDYVTREFFDAKVTAAEEAQAAVDADRASVKRARLNLGYCKMYSSVNGRVGRTLVHVGNLVGAGEDTLLANIVQLDPIYVYFNPSEQDYRKIMEKKGTGPLRVTLKFDDGSTYKYAGDVDFVNNVVDTSTSTVTMRAVMPNPEQTLLPGVYADAYLLINEVPDTLLVPQAAVAEDQGGPYVLVVDKEDRVELKHVDTGDIYEGMRIIKKGLAEGERVIIDGLQLVRPGMKVDVGEALAGDVNVEDKTKKAGHSQ